MPAICRKGGPIAADLGRNGSYLVYRQLAQDVREFWRWVAEEANRVKRGGRRACRSDGRAQARRAGRSPISGLGRSIPGIEAREMASTTVFFCMTPIQTGLSCPLGSHIRRANPRTGDAPGGPGGGVIDNLLVTLGLTTRRTPNPTSSHAALAAQHHDLAVRAFAGRCGRPPHASTAFLRRGREYGTKLDLRRALNPAEPDPETGIHFLCLNANIARQFEFVQGCLDREARKFAALTGEQDPLLGNRETVPDIAGRRCSPTTPTAFSRPEAPPQLPLFGAGCHSSSTFAAAPISFLPGLAALKWIAGER